MIDNVNVVSIFSCSSSSDGVLHMEVDKVADEVANMVVDMEVDKGPTREPTWWTVVNMEVEKVANM